MTFDLSLSESAGSVLLPPRFGNLGAANVPIGAAARAVGVAPNWLENILSGITARPGLDSSVQPSPDRRA